MDVVHVCRGWAVESGLVLHGRYLRADYDHTICWLHRHAFSYGFWHRWGAVLPTNAEDQVHRLCPAVEMG